jgi:monoterpene epsilon-lactone hydrolase
VQSDLDERMTSSAIERLNAYFRANPPKSAMPDDMRAWFLALVEITPKPDDAKLDSSTCPVPASWIHPAGADPERVILYCHGGAYILGSPATHLEMVHRFAKAASARALAVDYRLLPENPYPACIDDIFDAYRYLLKEGIAPSRIAIAGDSAGGGITMTTALRIRDARLPQPGCLVCISPWVDFTASSESLTTNAQYDAMLDPRLLPVLIQMILNGRDPVASSPLFADLSHLPPLLIQAGMHEALIDDSRKLADRYKAAGASVVLDAYENMTHVFQAFPTFVPEAIQAIERAGAFVREKLP